MAIELTDDGTMDTVLRCSECGKEMRYNYDGGGNDCPVCSADERSGCMCALDKAAWEKAREKQYDAFIEWAIEDATADHECPPDEDNEARLIALGFDKGSRGCSQYQALSINGTPTHEAGCPHQTHECAECEAEIPKRDRLCESCANPDTFDNDSSAEDM